MLFRSPGVRSGLAWFDDNEENVSAAVRTTVDEPGLRKDGVRLVRAALWAWMMRERFEDLQRGVLAFGAADAPVESEADAVIQAIDAIYHVMVAARGGEPIDEQAFATRMDAIVEAARRQPSELSAAAPTLLAGVQSALADHHVGAVWSRGFRLDLTDGDELPEWTRAFLSLLASAIAQNSGDIETLGIRSEQALEMFRELGDVWGIAFASQMRSEWLLLEGRLEEALEVADSATTGLEGLTSLSDVTQQRGLGINALLRLGRVDEARERLDLLLEVAHADGSERSILQAEFTAATFALAEGDGEAALGHLALLPGLTASDPVDQLIAWGGSLAARAHLLSGRPDAARAELRTALAPALRSGDQPVIADTALTLATWLAATGRIDDARRAFAASIRIRGGVDATDPTVRRLSETLGTTQTAPEEYTSGAAMVELEQLARLLD